MKKLILILTTLIVTSPIFADENEEITIVADTVPAYAAHANPNKAVPDNEAIFINSDLKIIPVTQHSDDLQLHYSMDVTYPQISGDPLSAAAQQFNQQILDKVNAQVTQFKTSVAKDAEHMKTLPEEVQRNTFKLDYDLDVVHPDHLSFISVRLSTESMQAGRAHPFHSHDVLNYDLTHGKELVLKDLFKSHADYLQTIAKFSHQQLNQTLQERDQWMIAEGTKPNEKNYKNWNLEEDALLITFDEYQVAPYVYGAQEVEIPYSALEQLLAPKSAILSSIHKTAKEIA